MIVSIYTDTMPRQELDSRKSDKHKPTMYEAVATKFNNVDYTPFSSAYSTLHPDFAHSIWLKKGEYEMTPEKVKDFLDKTKAVMTSIITRYEKCGNGCMSKKEDCDDWGRFSINLCDGDDDRSGYLQDGNSPSILYMRQKFDELDLVSFSCANLPSVMTATSTKTATVATKCDPRRSTTERIQAAMSNNVAKVGDGIHMMASMEMQRQISALEENKFQLEIRKLEFDPVINEKSIKVVDRRISSLSNDIETLKRRKVAHENNNNKEDSKVQDDNNNNEE